MNKTTQRKIREKNQKVAKAKHVANRSHVLRYESPPEAEAWERRTRERIEIDMREIFIPACQREEQPNSIKIEGAFNPARLDAPLVNVRKPLEGLVPGTNAYLWESQEEPDRKYALTDGYQRITALIHLAERSKYPWRIMVDSIQASVEFENWVFIHQDKFKKPLSRASSYSSALSTDEPVIVKIDSIVRRNGFYVPNKVTKKGETDIAVTSPTGPEETFKLDNEGVVLDRSLKIIRNCWSSYDKAGHHDIIKGVGRLVRDYGSKITPEVEDTWRTNVQVGALLEAAKKGTAQTERAQEVALKLRKAAKITKKPNMVY